jgi:predicted dehydrogenase
MGRPNDVLAMANMGETGVDVDCGMLFQYADGRMAHLHSTILAETKTEAFIYGDKGTIHIHSRWHEPSWFSLIKNGGRPQNFHFDYLSNGYHYEAEEVVKCLLEGKTESDLLPLSFSMDLIELLDEIREKAGIQYPGID